MAWDLSARTLSWRFCLIRYNVATPDGANRIVGDSVPHGYRIRILYLQVGYFEPPTLRGAREIRAAVEEARKTPGNRSPNFEDALGYMRHSWTRARKDTQMSRANGSSKRPRRQGHHGTLQDLDSW
ncbi:hypothetical protein BKA80DRAFT_298200 [Phyllosticta citrichinensis]